MLEYDVGKFMDDYQKDTIESYDKIAAEFHERNQVSIWSKEYDLFAKYIKGKKVLDIGCGTGRDAEYFINNDFDYTGIDASLGMLDIAQKRVPSGNFIEMDFHNLGFSDNTFDGFWAAASFLHVSKKEVTSLIIEALRILKPGGLGFISVKERKGIEEGVVTEDKLGGIKRFFAFYKKDEFKKILEDLPCKILNITTEVEKDGTKWFGYFIEKSK